MFMKKKQEEFVESPMVQLAQRLRDAISNYNEAETEEQQEVCFYNIKTIEAEIKCVRRSLNASSR